MCREAGEGKEREICRILEGKVGKVNRIRRRRRGERRGTGKEGTKCGRKVLES